MSAVPDTALRLWRRLAGDPSAFAAATRRVTRDTNGFCPPGWVGVVRLGDAIAIDPGIADPETVRGLLDLDDPTEPAQVRTVVSPQRALGPAELAYLPDGWRPPGSPPEGVVLEERDVAGLRDWLATLPDEDLAESSVVDMPAVVVASVAGDVVGAVGHLAWPERVAHIGIVVAPGHRRRGIGRALAVAGTTRARQAGLAPQWRAATDNDASRALAASVGYVQVGCQYSFDPSP